MPLGRALPGDQERAPSRRNHGCKLRSCRKILGALRLHGLLMLYWIQFHARPMVLVGALSLGSSTQSLTAQVILGFPTSQWAEGCFADLDVAANRVNLRDERGRRRAGRPRLSSSSLIALGCPRYIPLARTASWSSPPTPFPRNWASPGPPSRCIAATNPRTWSGWTSLTRA